MEFIENSMQFDNLTLAARMKIFKACPCFDISKRSASVLRDALVVSYDARRSKV